MHQIKILLYRAKRKFHYLIEKQTNNNQKILTVEIYIHLAARLNFLPYI